jgi:nucleoside-diphosphate-sugar epimerase
MVEGKKILFTGATGRVTRPVAESMAKDNEVWVLARFSDPTTKAELEALGARTYEADMVTSDLEGLPDDFTHVMHAGFIRDWENFERCIDATVRAAGALMMHCRRAEAFLFMSSTVVYKALEPGHLHAETDPLGGTSTALWNPAYAASKIAAEGAVRAFAHVLDLPTVITRLSVQYGAAGGTNPYTQGGLPMNILRWMLDGKEVPIRANNENWASPVHSDDVVRFVPRYWNAASVPANVVNLGGDEACSLPQMVAYLTELTGVEAKTVVSEAAPGMVAPDWTKRNAITGPAQVAWRDGFRRTVEMFWPDLVRS